ncbi:hypothetical protein BCR43DRAFT_496770 [Syncephalastrum racemosum]|uniref:Uncharacterized protein n=1 Tax=Syncephalastrum racemosum TaxID=13706 RepID=A0A1X2H5V9_SYNRA|nr:hypothetical protein BCR43DRAFT_496770 [Syncephalastrum racemosum]
MQFIYALAALAAVLATSVNAVPHWHHSGDCYIGGSNNQGDTHGALNGLLGGGILSDNSQNSENFVICDD